MTAASHGRSGRPWRRLREQVLREEPFCFRCGAPATQVDHIRPLSMFPELAHERSNLRGSCARHNAQGGAAMTNAKRAGRMPAPAPRGPFQRELPCSWDGVDRLPCNVTCGGSLARFACRFPVDPSMRSYRPAG